MNIWKCILPIFILINRFIITPTSCLKFKGCKKQTADDFGVAAIFILNNWKSFESDVEAEANVNIKKCLRRKLKRGKVNCIGKRKRRKRRCGGKWCGRAMYGARQIKICKANFLTPLQAYYDRATRLKCVATLMVHEFAHTCFRAHKTVNRIDLATINWWMRTYPIKSTTRCPCISPGS
eukprot:104630_1